jgi:hypothetical protein
MIDERAFGAHNEHQISDVTAADNQAALCSHEVTKKFKRKNPREFDDARYAALGSRAHSYQARSLVDTVTDLVAGHELAAGARTNKRKKKQPALTSAVERLLADLLLAQISEKANGYVYRSMRPEGFTESDVSYRLFKALVDALVDLGLLEQHKGYQAWGEPFGARVPLRQKATRFRATRKLLRICDQHGVRAVDFHHHFLIPLPENPLQVRPMSRRNEYGDKIRGKPMRFERTAHTERLEHQLKELNAFFDTFELRGGIHRGYIRVFNNGDHSKFNWNMGGRLYSYGEGNYQQMERADRLRMTINGEPVCEIDIRASYLTIFHALYGEPFDATNDPYDVLGLGPEARDVVKMWVTASFGNNAPITKWPKELVAKYRERTGKRLGKRYSAAKIGENVIKRFPLLIRLGEIVDGRERGWAELMHVESEAMLSTMQLLMNGRKKIPSLAVHDSIIVPISSWNDATIDLAHWYHRVTNAWPVLVPHFPEGHVEPALSHNVLNYDGSLKPIDVQ